MCGRTRCTLSADCVALACSKVTPDGSVPRAPGAPVLNRYSPSTNVPPTRHTPVLVGQKRGEDDDGGSPYAVTNMLWGFVPAWYRGEDPTKHGLTTNNARVEGIATSKLYKPAMNRGHRCVVVVDGFYEWNTDKASGRKQPYLIYNADQPKGVAIQSMSECSREGSYSEKEGWLGPTPLFMAAIYSETRHGGSDEIVQSYSVLTRESNAVFSWLHHRVPVILANKEDVAIWLNHDLDSNQALAKIREVQEGDLAWHPVSKAVGNVRNQDADLGRPVELGEKTKEEIKPDVKKSAGLMANWLKRGKEDKDAESTKKIKKEDE